MMALLFETQVLPNKHPIFPRKGEDKQGPVVPVATNLSPHGPSTYPPLLSHACPA